MVAPRRSARSNKGQHSQRELDVALVNDSDLEEEITTRKRSISAVEEDNDDGEYKETGRRYKRDDQLSGDEDDLDVSGSEETKVFKSHKTSRSQTQVTLKPEPEGLEAAFKKLRDKARINVCKAFMNVLKQQLPAEQPGIEWNRENVALEWSMELEKIINKNYTTKDRRYTDKSRSTMTLLKKPTVLNRLIDKSLTLDQLINSSPQDIDEDLKKYADKVKQDAIKRLVISNDDNGQRIRRTHKGDEVVEDVSDSHKQETEQVNIVGKSIDHRRFSDSDEQKPVVRSESTEESKPEEQKPEEPKPEVVNYVAQFNYNTADLGGDDDEYSNPLESESDNDMPGYDNSDMSDDDDFGKIMGNDSKPTTAAESDKEESPKINSLPSKPMSLPSKPKLPPKPLKSAMKKPGSLPPMLPKIIWQGPLTYPDMASFNCQFEFVTHSAYSQPKTPLDVKLHNHAINVSKDIFSKPTYYVKGKLPFQTADKYLYQVSNGSPITKDLYIFKVTPLDNHHEFEKLLHFLGQQYKAGVLSAEPSFVKSTYLVTLDGKNIPPYLQNLKNFEDKRGMFSIAVVEKEYNPKNPFNPVDPNKPSVTINLPEEASESHADTNGPLHLISEPYPKGSVLDSILNKLSESGEFDNTPKPVEAVPQMTNEQLLLLSSIVQQNPQVQGKPNEIINLLQNQRNGNGY